MTAAEEMKAKLTIALEMAIRARSLQIDENEALDNTLIYIEEWIERALAILDGALESP